MAEASLAYWKALTAGNAEKAWIDKAKADLDEAVTACTPEEQATLKSTHAELKDWKAPDKKSAEPDSNVFTLDQITSALTKTVGDMIALKMPAQKEQITAEQIKTAVDTALAAHTAKLELKAALDPVNLTNIVGQAIDTAVKGLKLPSKMQFGPGSKPGDKASGPAIIPGRTLGFSRQSLAGKQLLNIILRKEMNQDIPEADLAEGEERADHSAKMLHYYGVEHAVKALTTYGDGTGAEWMPRNLSSILYERVYLESALAQSFLAQEIQMTSDTMDSVMLTTWPTMYLNNIQLTEPPVSEIGTGRWTLTCQRLMGMCQFSYEANEDSIIPVLPVYQRTMALSMADALENAIINGDTTATHMDTGSTVAANDQLRAWKGLRKLALAVSGLKIDLSTGGVTTSANLLSVVGALGTYGIKTQDVTWVVGPKAWIKMLAIDEIRLAYNNGRGSTYVNGGPIPAPWGGSIVLSPRMREDLNAAGVWDNTTTTKGSIIAFNRAGFRMGSRRDIMVEVERKITSQHFNVVASVRKAFAPVETPSASVPVVAIGYNYTA